MLNILPHPYQNVIPLEGRVRIGNQIVRNAVEIQIQPPSRED